MFRFVLATVFCCHFLAKNSLCQDQHVSAGTLIPGRRNNPVRHTGGLLFNRKGLLGNNKATTADPGECCSPDWLFLIDITDNAGFTLVEARTHIRGFLFELFKRNANRACDQIRGALIEYGKQARVNYDFKRHPSNIRLRMAFRRYRRGRSLGDVSNALAALMGAELLLTKASRGNRPSSPNTIIWLVRSTPTRIEQTLAKANMLKKFAKIVVVAVGSKVDQSIISPIATSPELVFSVSKASELVDFCKTLDIEFCPPQPEPTNPTTSATTTTTPTTTVTTTTTTKLPTTPASVGTTIQDATDTARFCFQCRRRRNHLDMYADPVDCHYYYQCFYLNETSAIGIRQSCPKGTFWREAILQCLPEGLQPCVDRCMEDEENSRGCYAGVGCRQFFVCANMASYGMCCPLGSAFNEATCNCQESGTCTDDCEQPAPAVATSTEPNSMFNATVCLDPWGVYISTVSGNPSAFVLINELGQAVGTQNCPVGLLFSLKTCSCSEDSGVSTALPVQLRPASLWIPFDVDDQDHSVNMWQTFPYGDAARDDSVSAVGTGGSAAMQAGFISVPGMKTFDMRDSGSWCAFFRCDSGPGFACSSSGGILSNNKDSSASEFTVIISIPTTNTIKASLQFRFPLRTVDVTSAISGTPPNGWNHMCLTFDGTAIRLYLNENAAVTEITSGYLAIAHCPFVVGDDQLYGWFRGHIDNVLVSKFTMSPDEVEAHRTGNHTFLEALGFW